MVPVPISAQLEPRSCLILSILFPALRWIPVHLNFKWGLRSLDISRLRIVDTSFKWTQAVCFCFPLVSPSAPHSVRVCVCMRVCACRQGIDPIPLGRRHIFFKILSLASCMYPCSELSPQAEGLSKGPVVTLPPSVTSS